MLLSLAEVNQMQKSLPNLTQDDRTETYWKSLPTAVISDQMMMTAGF